MKAIVALLFKNITLLVLTLYCILIDLQVSAQTSSSFEHMKVITVRNIDGSEKVLLQNDPEYNIYKFSPSEGTLKTTEIIQLGGCWFNISWFGPTTEAEKTAIKAGLSNAVKVFSISNSENPVTVSIATALNGGSSIIAITSIDWTRTDLLTDESMPAGRWYPHFLLEHMLDSDVEPLTPSHDIEIFWNKTLTWDLSTTGGVARSNINLMYVIMHEFMHGMGISCSADFDGGLPGFGYNAAPLPMDMGIRDGDGNVIWDNPDYYRNDDLYAFLISDDAWFELNTPVGYMVKLYAPSKWSGQSFSHIDDSYNLSSNQLMTPFYNPDTIYTNIGWMAKAILETIGWGEKPEGSPTADFSVTPTGGVAPLTVQFTDLSTTGEYPIKHIGWNFGDENGSYSYLQNPQFTYTNAGNYKVHLIIDNGVGLDTKIRYINVRDANEFNKPMTTGWNWFSVYLSEQNMSPDNILASLNPQVGDYIKDRKGTGNSAQFYDIPGTFTGWTGTLTELDPKETYKIKLANQGELIYQGYPIDYETEEIPVEAGWNWIGYPIPFEMPVSDYLTTLDLLDGDYLKDQINSTTYYDAINDWFGQLETMIPGNGYVLNVANSGSIHEPPSEFKASNLKSKEGIDLDIPKYAITVNEFEFSGSAIIEVFIEGNNIGSENSILYAFNEDEQCVGIINGLLYPMNNKYLYNLMMYSNVKEGNELHFKFFNSDDNKWYTFKETLAFKEDMIIANAYHPFELRKAMTADLSADEANIKVYPNPFREGFTYSFTVIEDSNVRISIIDASGKIIEVLKDQLYTKGEYSFEWKNSGIIGGVYYLRIKMDSFEKTIPIIKTN